MRYYDARFLLSRDDRTERITVRVVRRKWAADLLPGWTWQLLGPLAIGVHVAETTPKPPRRFTLS